MAVISRRNDSVYLDRVLRRPSTAEIEGERLVNDAGKVLRRLAA